MLPEALATAAAGLFAGAALLVTVAENPARSLLPPEHALAQFRASYRRAAALQAPLALLALAAGVTAWWRGAGSSFLAGGLLVGAAVPFTLLAIRPTNDRLLGKRGDLPDREVPDLLHRWGRLHALRTLLGLGGFLACLAGWLVAA